MLNIKQESLKKKLKNQLSRAGLLRFDFFEHTFMCFGAPWAPWAIADIHPSIL